MDKKLSEKLENKAIDVGGKIVEEGAKQLFGIGNAFGLLIKLGAVGGFLVILSIIALVIFLVAKFL